MGSQLHFADLGKHKTFSTYNGLKYNPLDGVDLTRKEIEKLIDEINKRLAEIEDSAFSPNDDSMSFDDQMEIFKRNNLKLTSREVATMLGCSRQKARALRASGELTSFGYNDVVNYLKRRKG